MVYKRRGVKVGIGMLGDIGSLVAAIAVAILMSIYLMLVYRDSKGVDAADVVGTDEETECGEAFKNLKLTNTWREGN